MDSVTGSNGITITISSIGGGIPPSPPSFTGNCFEMSPLVLSDTFNTWFEKTNEIINNLNNISILGLDPFLQDDLKNREIRILSGIDGSCYKRLRLDRGPFLGFVETSNTSIYGLGTTANPYRLTLSFPSNQQLRMDDTGLSDGDFFIVEDVGDSNFPVKKVSTKAVRTKVVSGDKISVTFTDPNTYTISYVDLSYSPTFLVNNSSSPVNRFIGTGKFANNAPITFTLGFNPGNIYPALANIAFDGGLTPDNSINATINDFSSGTGSTSVTSTIPSSLSLSSFGYGGSKSRFIRYRADSTSQGQSPEGILFSQESFLNTFTINFGWRFGFHTTTNPNFNFSDSNINTAFSHSISSTPQLNVASRNISQNNITVLSPSGESLYYMYFIYSDNNNNNNQSLYGWVPTIYNNGSPLENAWINRGIVNGIGNFDGETFRILRFRNAITDNQFSFAIGGDSNTIPPDS